MHPFGGTPRCPRCEKSVYAAEQVMGPGRKLYHKPCLSCMICKKRLDSVSLLEHEEQPYCKNCHVKNFGARNLHQANLPDRDEVFGMSPPKGKFVSPPSSPRKFEPSLPSVTTAPSVPVRRQMTSSRLTNSSAYTPILRPNMNRSSPVMNIISDEDVIEEAEEENTNLTGQVDGSSNRLSADDAFRPRTISQGSAPAPNKVYSNHTGTTGRFAAKSVDWTPPNTRYSATVGRSASMRNSSGQTLPQLKPTATGTRYGNALGGGGIQPPPAPARQWGSAAPTCPKCGKSVYFAEQVKAIGKFYHKACLRCTSCDKRLDSFSLLEHDSQPYCKLCHVKNFGTRDLRQANLPNRDEVYGLSSPPTSPRRIET